MITHITSHLCVITFYFCFNIFRLLSLRLCCVFYIYWYLQIQSLVCVHLKLTSMYITGSIPLRQLVYRVLALPPSMQPLVYDFGQLTNVTEKDYTIQIVKDRVSVCYNNM